ncbi:HAD-IA family hydrolase [Nocardia africana]|uniref:HAD-IA family hydrolase n=1 Tax=Nocardia africana TaxID=134964 RepID=A0ABW6NCL3_9NOCA
MSRSSSWYVPAALAGLQGEFGEDVELAPAHVDWDNRAVCRATLPGGDRVVVKIDSDEIRHRRETVGLLAALESGVPVPRVRWHGRHAAEGPWVLVLDEIAATGSLADGGGSWHTAGAAVRALHDTDIPAGMAMFAGGVGDWESHLDHRVAVETRAAIERGLLSQGEADAVRRYAAEVLRAAGPAHPVLVHGDLQARHLLLAGDQVVLIDFGDVGWGDAAMDLVVLTHFAPHRLPTVLDGYGADERLRARVSALAPLYSLWRNLFVSRWYFENDFEQRRNSELARRVVQDVVLPSARATRVRLECEAVLVDFDGLLIDTEYAGWRSWNELYARFGGAVAIEAWAHRSGSNDPLAPWDELERLAGAPVDRVGLEQQRRVRRDLMLTVLPGVHDFLNRCRAGELMIALVSNSPRKWIERQMDALGLDPTLFDLILPGTGHAPKPAPDGYLKALAVLGVAADRAIAFEDSARGVEAARAAGLRCIAVPNRVTIHNDFLHADLVVSGLEQIEPVPAAKHAGRVAL